MGKVKNEWLKKYVEDKKMFSVDCLMAHTSNDLLGEIETNPILEALAETSDSIIKVEKTLSNDTTTEPEGEEDRMWDSFDDKISKLNKSLPYYVNGNGIRVKFYDNECDQQYRYCDNSLFMTVFEQKIAKTAPHVFASVEHKRLLNFIWGGYDSIIFNPRR